MANKKGVIAKRNSSGYTLVELIVVIAIVIALILVGVFAIVNIQKHLRQAELDSKAETIYMAAQQRMVELRASGYENVYQYVDSQSNGVKQLGYIPCDAGEDSEYDLTTICYVDSALYENGVVTAASAGATDGIGSSSSAASSSSSASGSTSASGSATSATSSATATRSIAAKELLPEGSVDEELRSNQWNIEFDPESGSIYGVFYSEDSSIPQDTNTLDSYRIKKKRFNAGATVGYYGGDAVATATTDTLHPGITVENEEQLKVTFYCNNPSAGEKLSFEITLSDGTNTYKKIVTNLEQVTSRTYRYVWTLDSLESDATRFYEQTEHRLNCGTTLNISLTVRSTDDMVDDASAKATTNSLFGYIENSSSDTAIVSCARHLQNLDSASHVSSNITKAVQISDISFADDEANTEDYYSLYGNSFTPIENSNLKSYTGKSYILGSEISTSIYSLHIANASGGQAGLFKTFAGTISDVTLTGVRIDRGTYVGALVGSTTGALTLENCQVYLSSRQGDLEDITTVDDVRDVSTWIYGNVAGGLVGRASYPVVVNSSFASTVLYGNTCAGGLIGQVNARVNAQGVYADCYVVAPTTGGLFGSTGGSASISLRDFYSAGYLAAPYGSNGVAAGIVPGTLYGAEDGYSACSFVSDDGLDTYSTASSASGSISNVYYLSGDAKLNGTQLLNYSQLSKQGASMLGAAFTSNSGGTTYPYNLMAQGLSTYSYPRLSELEHYGDWQAEFESGRLVYFERYADGSYGFEGANVSALQNGANTVALGDGYALAYTSETFPSSVVTIEYNGSSYSVTATKNYAVTNSGETYYLVPLPTEVLNPTLGSNADFYHEIVVKDSLGETTYYFNPYFAKTATINNKMPDNPSTVYVRTARQLYALSLYYANIESRTSSSTFSQELNIDYSSYDWSSYSTFGSSISKQAPISGSGGFRASYNGSYHTITGVSVESYNAATGFFGTVAQSGSLRNIFLAGTADTSTIKRLTSEGGTAASGSRNSSQVGALAGVNNGSISNCAVSGYSITYYGYNYNVVALGGLVGQNNGTVRTCSVDSPKITIASNNSYSYVGGFVGRNAGGITNSYSVGLISVLDARSSTVWAAGFAGENGSGATRSCYAACAVTASGTAETYGFARIGGTVSDCYYLDEGTYSYCGQLYAYNTSTNEYGREGKAAGARVTGEELQNLSLGSFASASASYNADATEGTNYLYPAVVRQNGAVVHYGNWPVQEFIGTAGVFYWEYEEGGSNSGYHFSYVGYKDGESISGSSLCEEHDDGGVINAYGYGYFYEADATDEPTLNSTNITVGSENAEAGAALHEQMASYIFVAYQTGEGSTNLRTTGFVRNGTWDLTTTENNVNAKYTFVLSPFFGNAMNLQSITINNQNAQELSTVEPGGSENTYEIRSEAQLQFINWNSEKATTSYSITSSNYNARSGSVYARNCYPYLLSGSPGNIPTKTESLYWVQSHDVDAYEENGGNVDFTPIGSMYDKDDSSSAAKPYVAYFPYSYDGKSYAIKNVEIHTTNQAIGLFGVTAGAQLQNIVMYSDKGNKIVNEAGGSDWYTMGGLVGFAGSGKSSATEATDSVFKNCTVSGYVIVDQRGSNSPGWGGACVGGLVGMTNMDIENCSAANDIEIRIGEYSSKAWTNLRVGGIAGVCRATINSCYAGGSIRSYVTANDTSGSNSVSIWAGGIVGGIVVRNSGDLSTLLGYVDRTLLVTNCYSYVDMPSASWNGTGYNHVRSSMSIASNGEMLSTAFGLVTASKVRIYNCYALKDNVSKSTDYTLYSGTSSSAWQQGKNINNLSSGVSDRSITFYNDSTPYLSYEEMSESMLANLNKSVTARYDYGTGSAYTTVTETGNFNTVTTTEQGVAIDGKYSFPGTDTELKGLNYPFPTVLTQTDVFGNTVNVHYGAWPKLGIYWDKPSVDFNLYANRQEISTGETISLLELKLNIYGTASGSLDADDITFTDDEGNPLSADEVPLEVYSVSKYTSEGTGKGYYTVTFIGIREGTAFVHAVIDDQEAQTTITVENSLTIKASESKISLEPGEEKSVDLTFFAQDATGAEQQLKPSASSFSYDVVIKSGDSLFLCDDGTVSYNATTGTLNVGAIGRVIDSLESGEGYVAITCTYKYGTGEGEKMEATQNLIVEVSSPDFASLKVGTQSSTHGFAKHSGAVDQTSMPTLTSALGDVESGLFLRHGYTNFNDVDMSMFTLRVGGVEYTPDSNGNVYRTVVDASGASTQELLARIVLGNKLTNSTYSYDYYALSVEDYTLEEDATLVAKVRNDVSLQVKIPGVPKIDPVDPEGGDSDDDDAGGVDSGNAGGDAGGEGDESATGSLSDEGKLGTLALDGIDSLSGDVTNKNGSIGAIDVLERGVTGSSDVLFARVRSVSGMFGVFDGKRA
jgi:type II secretory pathway pseudopilin PulG